MKPHFLVSTESLFNERNIHFIFVLSILVKAVDGAVEIILGIALVFIAATMHVIQSLVQDELIEDPTDLVANAIQHFVYPFLTHSHFASAYLLSHGAIKLVLVASLLRNRLWAYPAAILVFALFIVYQIYLFCYSYSVSLVLLTIFDFIVIVLTWHEYQFVRDRQRQNL